MHSGPHNSKPGFARNYINIVNRRLLIAGSIGLIVVYSVSQCAARWLRQRSHSDVGSGPTITEPSESSPNLDQPITPTVAPPSAFVRCDRYLSLRQWRLLVFPSLGVGAMLFGFISWHNGSPPEESRRVINMPQGEQIYESNPSIPLHVTADFSYDAGGGVVEYLFIKTPERFRRKANHIAVVMVPENPSNFARVPADYNGLAVNAELTSLKPLKKSQVAQPIYGKYLGIFFINWAVELNRGVLFIHLPAIGNGRGILGFKVGPPGVAEAMSEYKGSRPVDVLTYPEVHHGSPKDPWNYYGSRGDTRRELLYLPHSMAVKEIFDASVNNNLHISDYQVQSSQPSVSIVDGNKFVWTGNGLLTSYLTAVDPNSAENRANSDFRAGIALAIGAALIIAALQERRRKFRRRSNSESDRNASGVKPESVADPEPTDVGKADTSV
jgi:hypothetical protein